MGLNTRGGNGGSGKTYLKLANGKITREWQEEPKDDWIPLGKSVQTRTVTKGKNEGKTRWYIEYDDVSGFVLSVELKKVDKINIIELLLQDGPETFIISIPEDSAYGQDFMLKMKNIDLTKELVVSPWSMTPEEWLKLTGKKRANNKVGLALYTGSKEKDNTIDKYYTTETPNGLPELVEETKKGETTWNSTARDNFLYDELVAWIESANKQLSGPTTTAGNVAVSDTKKAKKPDYIMADAEEKEINPDDLPF